MKKAKKLTTGIGAGLTPDFIDKEESNNTTKEIASITWLHHTEIPEDLQTLQIIWKTSG